MILMGEMPRLPSDVAGAPTLDLPSIIHCGTDEQKHRWLPGLFSWQTSFCLAITEPTAGSDVGANRATPTNSSSRSDRWKKASRLPSRSEIPLLVVSLDSPGNSMRKTHNTGHNGSGSSWVEFGTCESPSATSLARRTAGSLSSYRNFNKERFILTVYCNRQALRYTHDHDVADAV